MIASNSGWSTAMSYKYRARAMSSENVHRSYASGSTQIVDSESRTFLMLIAGLISISRALASGNAYDHRPIRCRAGKEGLSALCLLQRISVLIDDGYASQEWALIIPKGIDISWIAASSFFKHSPTFGQNVSGRGSVRSK